MINDLIFKYNDKINFEKISNIKLEKFAKESMLMIKNIIFRIFKYIPLENPAFINLDVLNVARHKESNIKD